MINKKQVLLAAIVSASSSVNVYADARSMGMGDAGVADVSSYSSVMNNPSLLSANKSSDDFAFKVGFKAFAEDEGDFATGVDDIDSLIFEIDEFTSQNDMSQQSNRDQLSILSQDLLDLLNQYDSESVDLDLAAQFTIAFPSANVSTAIHGVTDGRVAVAPSFSDDDKQTLQDLIDQNESDFESVDLTSEIVSYAVAESDIGISFAKSLPSVVPYLGQVNLGATIKVKQIDLFEDAQPINDFDGSAITESKITDQFIVADIGIYKNFPGGWTLGATAKDLGSGVVEGLTDEYKIEAQYKVGVSHNTKFSTLNFDYDISEKEWIGNISPEQYASVGVELKAGKHAQLRLGYKADLTEDGNKNIMSAGIGISPFGLLSVDLSGQMTDKEGYGASLDVGYKF